jgi:predicted DNA-binding transcriptional regulator AlpA
MAKTKIREFITIDQYAALTHQSPGQVRNLNCRGELPVKPIKVGRRLLWDRAEVESWVDGLLAARQA